MRQVDVHAELHGQHSVVRGRGKGSTRLQQLPPVTLVHRHGRLGREDGEVVVDGSICLGNVIDLEPSGLSSGLDLVNSELAHLERQVGVGRNTPREGNARDCPLDEVDLLDSADPVCELDIKAPGCDTGIAHNCQNVCTCAWVRASHTALIFVI